MRIIALAVLGAFPLLFSSACSGPAPEYRTTATVREVMKSIVEPNADYVWKSVATKVTAKGIEEKAPKTDDDWAELREHAIALAEATDLLQIPGRLVAHPGEPVDNPKVEEPPDVIKTMIDSDLATWIKYNHGLHDAVMTVIKAIDAKNVQAVTDAGSAIDGACEACHKQYWYPDKPDKSDKKK
jgi:hypothetical protein